MYKEQLHDRYSVRPPQLEDAEALAAMHAAVWQDTYVNEAYGISLEWVQERNWQAKLSPEAIEVRREEMRRCLASPDTHYYRLATDSSGAIVGYVFGERMPSGRQELHSLYFVKEAQGTGLAADMIEDFLAWTDQSRPVHVPVTSYNQRALRFYGKHGFSKVAGSDHIYADKLPSFYMIRSAKGEAL